MRLFTFYRFYRVKSEESFSISEIFLNRVHYYKINKNVSKKDLEKIYTVYAPIYTVNKIISYKPNYYKYT